MTDEKKKKNEQQEEEKAFSGLAFLHLLLPVSVLKAMGLPEDPEEWTESDKKTVEVFYLSILVNILAVAACLVTAFQAD